MVDLPTEAIHETQAEVLPPKDISPETGPEIATPPGPLAEFGQQFRRNKGAVLGLGVVVLLTLVALTAPLLAPHPPGEQLSPTT